MAGYITKRSLLWEVLYIGVPYLKNKTEQNPRKLSSSLSGSKESFKCYPLSSARQT